MLQAALERDAQARPFEQNIKRFGEAVMSTPALLERLDTAPDKESFIQLYRELAAGQGIHFSRDELLIAVQEQKQGSNWVIPKAVLRMIADRF
ncbi:MAG TPA: Nif11-like leader peptide family natural product precursor [Thiobacillaceae bacterium]|nr:Nif11-like leader peptide family natural product precursor [Thiobacillaceae bacterium]HNA82331.1 Nif11-like leader peptide family natural product precursor [Thiobacillaceae bacterium]HNF89253.1 Nif11-like leader peptide family natural product precursor [Thiobacillaceae bacterium]HNH88458.1 Nif11-like leader peptide family natural product precursor [Thiobacillaceae bacterium]HNI07242.1 Nif11-like leader peptide family natural product precursor [Thiobacillaceae bacterium]